VTELPAGGGDNGGRGGSSVGVAPGVPVIWYGVGEGTPPPPLEVGGVIDPLGVRVACWVGVARGLCPDWVVGVFTGPGYGSVLAEVGAGFMIGPG
jgi:hypothetical protein